MMKAIVRDAYGSVDVLRLAEIDKPVASEGEVLVRAHAAGLDQGVGRTDDTQIRRADRARRSRPARSPFGVDVDERGSGVFSDHRW
jgi:NADPH:quinone reductase-like Zn-dependent oxidoreductase